MKQTLKRLSFFFVSAVLVASALGCDPGSLSSSGGQNGAQAQVAETPPPQLSVLRPGNRYASAVGDRYLDEVQPALAQRCAVCHSCTNGPCQLNMTSYAALTRGVSSTNPYKWGLFDGEPTRVADNRPLAEWRGRGFRSVLPLSAADALESVFFKALDLGEKNLPGATPSDGPLNLSVVRPLAQAHDNGDYVCPATGAEFNNLVSRYPMGGMPWALPNDPEVHATLEAWVLDGAPGPSAAAQAIVSQPQITPLTTMDPNAVIAAWEGFFNADDLRSQLVARYIYEHTYSANIQLNENPGEFYRMVRSHTRAPQAIDAIRTNMPMDDPGAGRVFYRMEKIDRVIEGKVHVPWEISVGDIDHLRSLFFSSSWSVAQLPSYSSRNPFKVFEPIPAAARSQFMLENSRMLYAQFARGPICLVQAASYAVDEYFWILFIKPESDPSVQVPKLGLSSYDAFFTKDGNLVSGVPVLGDKYGEPIYRDAFERTLRHLRPQGLGAQDVWTGDGNNANSWLTVHRHQIAVDVHTTLDRPITGLPKSVWLMTYANFERMYYNAVDEYKYWGSLLHQNDTFNWQIYTRTEAEDLWASLFPDQSYRQTLRDRYTSFKGKMYNKLFTDYAAGRPSASPQYSNEDQLARALMTAMSAVLGPADRLNNWPNGNLPRTILPAIADTAGFEAGLRTLTNRPVAFGQFFPNVVHVRLGGQYLYTLLAVRGWKGDKIGVAEAAGRARENDYIVAVPGFAAYEAHMFVDLPFDRASAFLTELGAVNNLASWNTFSNQYKVGRNSPQFWAFVDWMNGWMATNIPVRAALLELRAYDENELPF